MVTVAEPRPKTPLEELFDERYEPFEVGGEPTANAGGGLTLTIGFDDTEYGTAELVGDDLHVQGDRPDVVRKVLNRWPKLRGAALLRRADEACAGRFWAHLEGGEDKPTQNGRTLHETLNAAMTFDEAVDQVADAYEELLDANPDLTKKEQDDLLDELLGVSVTANVFCATGRGGGRDPTCKLGQATKAVDKAKAGVAKAKANLAKAQAVLKSARADMKKVKAAIKTKVGAARKPDPAKQKAYRGAAQAATTLYSRASTGQLKQSEVDATFGHEALKKASLADLKGLAKQLNTAVPKSGGKAGLLKAMAATVWRRNGAKQRTDA